MNEKITKLKQLIKNCDKFVFFGGAGVSTESGIPDFRSKDGLYNKNYPIAPEIILSHDFFVENPDEFYKFYRNNLNFLDAKPNVTHTALAKLEQIGKLKSIVTQNIDGLHKKAGSKNVVELHGSIYRNHCTRCNLSYKSDIVFNSNHIPKCDCGGTIRPSIDLYGETLNVMRAKKAFEAMLRCNLLIVGGTSLTTSPAKSYLNFFEGDYVVIINKEPTEYDSKANLVIHSSLGEVFSEIIKDYIN